MCWPCGYLPKAKRSGDITTNYRTKYGAGLLLLNFEDVGLYLPAGQPRSWSLLRRNGAYKIAFGGRHNITL